MTWRRIGFVVTLTLLLVPAAVAAAPEGKVIIAQGVDPRHSGAFPRESAQLRCKQ